MVSALEAVCADLLQNDPQFATSVVEENGRSLRIWKRGPQSLIDVFLATRVFAGRAFIVRESERTSYEAFHLMSSCVRTRLRKSGVVPGARVAIIGQNSAAWLAAFFGTVTSGAIAAPINPSSKREELVHCISRIQPTMVVCDESLVQVLNDCQWKDNLPPEIRSISECVSFGSQAEPDPVEASVLPSDPACIFLTSGTTASAKLVVLSHRSCAYSVFHAAWRNARKAKLGNETAVAPAAGDGQQGLLLALPFFHTSGLLNGVLPLMMRGGKIVLLPLWSPRRALDLIAQEQVNILAGTPLAAQAIAARLSAQEKVPDSLRQIIFGGSAASATVATEISGAGLIPGQNWGMTETGGGVLGHLGDEFVRRPTSCGLPAPIHDVRIVDEDGAVVGPRKVGELQLRGPQVMIEYFGEAEATDAAFDQGWLRTGDLAFLDEDGYCHIVGRLKDVIIISGENVSCAELERVLESHPTVSEAAVVGIEDTVRGEVAAALVTIRDRQSASEEELRIFMSKYLHPMKVPVRILLQSEPLPRNALAKLDRAAIRKLLQ